MDQSSITWQNLLGSVRSKPFLRLVPPTRFKCDENPGWTDDCPPHGAHTPLHTMLLPLLPASHGSLSRGSRDATGSYKLTNLCDKASGSEVDKMWQFLLKCYVERTHDVFQGK